MSNGYIPEKITYVCPAKNMTALYRSYKISQMFEDLEHDNTLLNTINKENVLYTYAVDSNNKKRIESATNWAMQHYSVAQKDVTEFEMDNNISAIRILELEIRGEGGRAYKCVTPHGFYVDVREDVIMDVIENVGIEKNGLINAPFVWVAAGSQMKVVRKDSDLYKEYIQATEIKKTESIKDLKPNTLYKDRNGYYVFYLGDKYIYDTVDGADYYYQRMYRPYNEKSNTHGKFKVKKIKIVISTANIDLNKNVLTYPISYYNIRETKPSNLIEEVNNPMLVADIKKKLDEYKKTCEFNILNNSTNFIDDLDMIIYHNINDIKFLTIAEDKKNITIPDVLKNIIKL